MTDQFVTSQEEARGIFEAARRIVPNEVDQTSERASSLPEPLTEAQGGMDVTSAPVQMPMLAGNWLKSTDNGDIFITSIEIGNSLTECWTGDIDDPELSWGGTWYWRYIDNGAGVLHLLVGSYRSELVWDSETSTMRGNEYFEGSQGTAVVMTKL